MKTMTLKEIKRLIKESIEEGSKQTSYVVHVITGDPSEDSSDEDMYSLGIFKTREAASDACEDDMDEYFEEIGNDEDIFSDSFKTYYDKSLGENGYCMVRVKEQPEYCRRWFIEEVEDNDDISESVEADLRNLHDGDVTVTCYNIRWREKTDLPTYVKLNVPFRGYLDDNDNIKYDYIESIEARLDMEYEDIPFDMDWQIDDYGD